METEITKKLTFFFLQISQCSIVGDFEVKEGFQFLKLYGVLTITSLGNFPSLQNNTLK